MCIRDSFNRQLERIETERVEILTQMHMSPTGEIDLGATLSFAESLLADLPNIWNRLDWQQKPKFVRSLYPTGLIFEDGAIGTAETPWLLRVFPAFPDDLSGLAPPTGFEPVLPP